MSRARPPPETADVEMRSAGPCHDPIPSPLEDRLCKLEGMINSLCTAFEGAGLLPAGPVSPPRKHAAEPPTNPQPKKTRLAVPDAPTNANIQVCSLAVSASQMLAQGNIQRMPGDGHCLYHSMALLLGFNHNDLRQLASQAAIMPVWQQIMTPLLASTPAEWHARIQSGEWGR